MGTRENINMTRRKMISVFGWLALIPMAGLWDIMVKRQQGRAMSRSSEIPLKDIPSGTSYYSDYIINRGPEEIKIFSTRCPHLGCRIRPTDSGQLECPCHGSAFDPEEGKPLKGPAEKSLELLDHTIEDDFLTIYYKIS